MAHANFHFQHLSFGSGIQELLVQCTLQLTALLHAEWPSSLPAEVEFSSQATGISSTPQRQTVTVAVLKAKDGVLGEYESTV